MTWPEDGDSSPYVCPGCYAVGGEPCAPGCIDAELEEEHRARIESGDYERMDDALEYSDEPASDDGDDEQLNAIAILESALARSNGANGLHDQIAALENELHRSGVHPGARSCIWCRALVVDDFDHDCCEPDETTAVLYRATLLD